jgi:hypothetical protein
MLELGWQCGILLFFYWNCPDSVVICCFSWMLELNKKNTTMSVQFQHLWKTTKYHTVRTVPIEKQQNTTLSGQFQHLWKTTKYLWYFVVFLLELFWQCGILLFFIDVGTVLTLWYFVVFHGCWNCPDSVVLCYFAIGFWNCPDSVVLFFSWMLELSRQWAACTYRPS